MNKLAVLHEGHNAYLDETIHQYSQLKTFNDTTHKITWCLMNSSPRPCFTPALLDDLASYIKNIKTEMAHSNGEKYNYLVLGSDIDGIYNLGGDLELFSNAIATGDRAGLFSYAVSCINVLHQNIVHLECDLTTISLVQGDALGGGFETALASNIMIAERGTKLGLPEVLFNLFPGMGAFSLLSRKVGAVMAEKIILSGQMYTAEQFYEMGVVDILAEKGEAELALFDYIKKAKRSPNSYQAIRKVKDVCNQITYKELFDIAKIWTDAAFNLTDKDLRMMKRLVTRQNANVASEK